MADVDFVNSLYLNVLARDPDPDGLNAWVSYGGTDDQVRAAFINSVETQTFINPVIRLYEGLLGRIPDSAGLNAWADALRGGASLNSVTEAFLNSDEAIANGFTENLSNEAFVNKLYLSMGRTQDQIDADVDGVTGWLSALDSMSRATVTQAFMECAENLQHSNDFVTGYVTLRAHGKAEPSPADIDGFIADQNFVDGLYRGVLARDPDTDGANAWVGHLVAGVPDDEVTAAFINSAEAQTFVNPIIRLYEGLLNRAPDVDGLKAWVAVFRGGASLTEITNAFLNSDEAIANGFAEDLPNDEFVNKLYLSMGRTQDQIDADTAGVAGWITALDTMTKAQVAQAFMECAENQQNSDGFVTGWGALRAAGNPGPTTAQLDNFSDTASIDQIIASANAVGATANWPTGDGTSPINLSDTAANLAAADPRLLNGATNITVTDPGTIEQLAAIDAITTGTLTATLLTDTAANLAADAATNGGAGTYLPEAIAVTVTDAATIAQLQAIDAANGDGTLTYAAITDTATALAAAPALLNGATDITAIDPATVEQAVIIEAAANSGATTYNIDDSATNLALTIPAVLTGATSIDSPDGNVTLTDAQVTDTIVAKFDPSVNLTLNAALGTTLSALSATTLADANVVALNAIDDAVTLTDAQVTDGIVAKFDGSDDLTLHAASGATFSGLSAATLSDTDVVALDAGDNAVTLSDFDDGKVTNEIIAKFDALDRLTLNANQGTTFQALSATTLGDARVFVLDAFDNAVTLTNGQVTDAIVIKFDSSDTLTLNASGATLSALSAATLGNANATLALNADDDAITLTADQFVALGIAGDSIDAGDAITIESGSNLNALNLNSVGGGAVAVRFDALDDGSDDIANFDVATDTLQFSLTAFSGLSQTGAIDANAFLSGVLTGNGAEGTADTRFLYDTSSGNPFYDENGITAGGVVQVAALTTGTVLTENDIVMIA